MTVGVEFRQTLRGVYARVDDPGAEHPIELRYHVAVPLSHLLLEGRAQVRGELHAPGYARHAAIGGRLALRPLAGKLVHDFRFEGDDGRSRRFHGETEVRWQRPLRSLEGLVGRVFEDEREEVRVLLKAPVASELPRILRSLRTTAEL
ncbi:MAG: hypothetical protein AAGH15_24850 [Myxococcota bacterium]